MLPVLILGLLFLVPAASAADTLWLFSLHSDSTITRIPVTYYGNVSPYTVYDSIMAGDSIYDVCGTPTGTKFYAVDIAGEVLVYDVDGTFLKSIAMAAPYSIASDPTGSYIYVAGYDSGSYYVKVIDTSTDTVANTITGTGYNEVVCSSDGKYVLVLGTGTLFCINTTTMTGKTIATAEANWQWVDLDISPSGTDFAISGFNGLDTTQTRIWVKSIATSEATPLTLTTSNGNVNYQNIYRLTYAPDGDIYCIEDTSKIVRCYGINGLPAENITMQSAESLRCIAMTSDNRLFVAYTSTKNISVYNTESQTWLYNITDLTNSWGLEFVLMTDERVSYAPHYVTMIFKSDAATPVSGAKINVYKQDGTFWASHLTDTSGAVVFQMYEDHNYTVVANHTASGLNTTFSIIPSSSYYTYIFDETQTYNPSGFGNTTGTYNGTGNSDRDINCTVLYRKDAGSDTGYVDVYYEDWTLSTTNVTVIMYGRASNTSNTSSPMQMQTSTSFVNGTAQWNSTQVTQNVITNYGFESGQSNWTTHYAGNPGWGGGGNTWTEVVSDQKHTGAYAAKMAWLNSTGKMLSLQSDKQRVLAGQYVNASIWLRTTSLPNYLGINPSIYAVWYYSNGTPLFVTSSHYPCPATTTWTEFNTLLTPPAGYDVAYFSLVIEASGDGYDDLYIDDFTGRTLTPSGGSSWYTFVLNNCSGKEIQMKFIAYPAAYGEYKWNAPAYRYQGPLIPLPGFAPGWYYWVCVGFLFGIVAVAMSGSLGIGGGIMCFYAALFTAFGWFNPLGSTDLTYGAIGLGFIMSMGLYVMEKSK